MQKAPKVPLKFEVPFHLGITFSSISEARGSFSEPGAEVGG